MAGFLLLQLLLEGLQAFDQLLLFAGGQAVPDARPCAVQQLPGHGAHAALYVAREDALGEVEAELAKG
jgi:hypothetical protein